MQARIALHLRKEPDLQVSSVLPDFRERMTRWLVWVSVLNVVLTLIRVGVLGRGPVFPTLLMLGIDLLVLVGIERRPQLRPQLIALHTATAMLAICMAFFYWGFRQPPPNLLFLPTLAYGAVLIGTRWAVVTLLLTSLGAQACVALAGAASDPWGRDLMLYVALCTVLIQLCWHLLEQRVLANLHSAEQRAAELESLDGFRARICGTLFHDVANPMQVIGMVVELATRRGTLNDCELARLRRFHGRLSVLLRAAFEVLEHGHEFARERVTSARVQSMLDELTELFSFRLAEKAQTLQIRCNQPLHVLTVPELLRDSVLANLVSNAIKFSPHGATIELTATRIGGEAEIVVRDQGPGFSDELLGKLADGVRPESTHGTRGEQGLGLGLTLAAAHVRRMGGSLSLRRLPSGGSAATVRMPIA